MWIPAKHFDSPPQERYQVSPPKFSLEKHWWFKGRTFLYLPPARNHSSFYIGSSGVRLKLEHIRFSGFSPFPLSFLFLTPNCETMSDYHSFPWRVKPPSKLCPRSGKWGEESAHPIVAKSKATKAILILWPTLTLILFLGVPDFGNVVSLTLCPHLELSFDDKVVGTQACLWGFGVFILEKHQPN